MLPRIIHSGFLISLTAALPVSATTLSFSNYQTWAANVTNAVELDFTSINSTSGNYSTAAGKTLLPLNRTAQPVTFTGLFAGGYQLTGGTYGPLNVVSLLGPSSGGVITVSLPGNGLNSFLLGLGSVGTATSITVTLSDGQSFNVAAVPNTYEFLGLSLSHTINTLTITTPGQSIVSDFFLADSKLAQDATASPAPAIECNTLFLMAGGFLCLAGGRRQLFPSAFAA